jgi:hypothetical protein
LLEHAKRMPALGSNVLPALYHQILQFKEGHGVLRFRWL